MNPQWSPSTRRPGGMAGVEVACLQLSVPKILNEEVIDMKIGW